MDSKGSGCLDDLFSPEALQALAFPSDPNSCINPLFNTHPAVPSGTRFNDQLNQVVSLEDPPTVRNLSSSTPFRRRRKAHVVQNLPGYSVFDFAPVEGSKRKRSKFNERRREEVAHVREKGACLRCRYLKVSVRMCNPGSTRHPLTQSMTVLGSLPL